MVRRGISRTKDHLATGLELAGRASQRQPLAVSATQHVVDLVTR